MYSVFRIWRWREKRLLILCVFHVYIFRLCQDAAESQELPSKSALWVGGAQVLTRLWLLSQLAGSWTGKQNSQTWIWDSVIAGHRLTY